MWREALLQWNDNRVNKERWGAGLDKRMETNTDGNGNPSRYHSTRVWRVSNKNNGRKQKDNDGGDEKKNRSKNRDRYAYSVIIVHSLSSSCYLAVTGLTTWWGGLFPANQLVPSSRRRRALSLPSDFGETASVAGDFDFFSNTYRAATTTTTKRVRKEERNQEEKKRREGSVNGRVAVVRSLWYILLIFCSAC